MEFVHLGRSRRLSSRRGGTARRQMGEGGKRAEPEGWWTHGPPPVGAVTAAASVPPAAGNSNPRANPESAREAASRAACGTSAPKGRGVSPRGGGVSSLSGRFRGSQGIGIGHEPNPPDRSTQWAGDLPTVAIAFADRSRKTHARRAGGDLDAVWCHPPASPWRRTVRPRRRLLSAPRARASTSGALDADQDGLSATHQRSRQHWQLGGERESPCRPS